MTEFFPASPRQHEGVYEPPEQTPERPLENGEPFKLKLTLDDRQAFASLIRKIGLANAIGAIDPMMVLRQLQGEEFSDAEKAVAQQLKGVTGREQDREEDPVDPMNLRFRWTSAEPELSVERLVDEAYTYGGGPSDSSKPWTHIGDSVVEDFMANYQSAGVLFVYDGTKLRGVTEEERNAHSHHAAYYATVPAPGLELKDALVGMVSFDE